MTGTVAQLVAIVSNGNEYLKNGLLLSDLLEDNTAFKFCNQLTFATLKQRYKFLKGTYFEEEVIAYSAKQWYDVLKYDECMSLRLNHNFFNINNKFPDFKTAGFVGGGGIWLIEACFSTGTSEYWRGDWVVTNSGAQDQKIWTVNYRQAFSQKSIAKEILDITINKAKLTDALVSIFHFAQTNGENSFAEVFTEALFKLNTLHPEDGLYYNDILGKRNYDLQTMQILASCEKAWVFGGMGSWNDIGFEKIDVQNLYETLSANLYNAIVSAIVNVANH